MEQDTLRINALVKAAFWSLGFEAFDMGHPSANGPDLYIEKKGRCFSVEVKTARLRSDSGPLVYPVERNRRKDDFIAIVVRDYVLIEPMADHLRACSRSGYRTLSKL